MDSKFDFYKKQIETRDKKIHELEMTISGLEMDNKQMKKLVSEHQNQSQPLSHLNQGMMIKSPNIGDNILMDMNNTPEREF